MATSPTKVVAKSESHSIAYPMGPSTGPYDPVYPSAPPSPSDVNSVVNVQTGALAVGTKVPIVYGLQQIEGRVMWRGNATGLWTVIVGICWGPIGSVVSCKINDAVATGVTITYFTGTTTQSPAVDSSIAGGDYRLPLLAYARIDFPIENTEAYAQASKFSFVVHGKLCSDPRENRLTYSNDFRSTRGWTSTGTFPSLTADGRSGTGGASDWCGGTSASEYTFSSTPGTYDVYRDSTTSVASGEPLTGTIRMRVASGSFTGTMEVKKGSGSTTQSITVDTNWRDYVLTNTGSGSGVGRLRIYGIPASTVLRVSRASLQIKSEDYGYIETQGSVVTPNTSSYTTNPVLQIYDYVTDAVCGARFPTANVNAASFGRGAGRADYPTPSGSTGYYQAGMIISSDTSVRSVLEAFRAYCGAQLYEENGQLCIWVDVAQEDVLVAFDTTNAKDVVIESIDLADKPTRITVEYVQADDDYKLNTVQADDQGLTSPATVDLRESRYQLPGITDTEHALRIANYYLKLSQADLRAKWTSPWVGVRLYKGALVTLTCGAGLSAQKMLIETVKRLPSGEYAIEARKYDAAVYDTASATANTPPSTNFSDPYATPGAPIIGFAGSPQLLAIGPPRTAYASPQYGSSYWSTTNCTGVTASAINDGSSGATALTTAPTSTSVPANYAYVKFDAGSGSSVRFGRATLTLTAASSGAASTAVAGVYFQWSSDGSAWTNATTASITPKTVAGTGTTWSVTWEWPCKVAHRYWRLVQADTVGFALLELQFDTFTDNRAIHHYEIAIGGTSSSTRTATLPIALLDAEPTLDAPLVLPSPGYTTYAFDTLGYGSSGSEGHVSVRAMTIAGVIGSWASSDYQTIASASGTDIVARVQASMPGSAQTGHMNISGKMKAGQLEADPQASGTIPVVVNNVASPTVALQEWRLSGTVESKIDKKGSLQTLESSRIAPWIETRVTNTGGNVTVNSTTAVDITDSRTFTPPSDCRVLVVGCTDVRVDTTGHAFVGELVINGTAESPQIIYVPGTANDRVTIGQVWSVALTGGTSYTFKLQGRLDASGGAFTTIATHTGFSMVAVGKF